ncbi:major facilitator superfamily domain-containing protein [Dactylonectria macrodidyma]|uniref:Major facilitator superfamily domain-containing protein n=1 Tax=Dactylonectria macrodidyma TaxID=307937 RepID=A0A9P9DKJ2_9HYPO|nr:major facilitator superfamily domain-containing protein [Dactylonectria macrodidyma]
MSDLKETMMDVPAGHGSAPDSANGVSDVFIDPVLEKRTIAKFDKFMMPQMALLMLIAYLDRSNIGNARVFGFEEGIGLVGTQFNNLSTLFYPTYVVFEIPWVMGVKKFGANTILAVAMVGWSVVTLGTGFIHNYHQGIAMRLLLGVFESALFPCLAFIISTVYSREQQAKRIAVLYGAIALSGAFGGLIAYGIQLMGERAGLAAWRWLFIIEGCISIVIGLALWMTLPFSSEKAWFLNAEESNIMRLRIQRDVAYKGEEKFSWKYVRMAFTEPIIYIAAVGLFCSSIPLFGFSTFLPTIMVGLGYTSLQANYLSIPVYVFACLVLCSIAWLSDKLNKRAVIAMMVPIPVLIGYAIVIGTASHGAGLFAMFLIAAGVYPYNTLIVTWVTNNLQNEHVRSVGIPLLISIANASGIASSQIYPSKDKPRYVMGNSVSLGMEAAALAAVGGLYLVIRRRSAKKAALANAEDPEATFTYVL